MNNTKQKPDIYEDIVAAFFAKLNDDKQIDKPILQYDVSEDIIEDHWNMLLNSDELRELKEFTPMVVGIIKVIWDFGIENSDDILDFDSIRDVLKIIITYEKFAGNLPMHKYYLLVLMMGEYLDNILLNDDETYFREYLYSCKSKDRLTIEIENIVFEYIVNNCNEDYGIYDLAIKFAEINGYTIGETTDEKVAKVIKCIGREYFQCNNIC